MYAAVNQRPCHARHGLTSRVPSLPVGPQSSGGDDAGAGRAFLDARPASLTFSVVNGALSAARTLYAAAALSEAVIRPSDPRDSCNAATTSTTVVNPRLVPLRTCVPTTNVPVQTQAPRRAWVLNGLSSTFGAGRVLTA